MRLSFPSLSELGVILFAVFQWCHANVLSESATKMRGAAKAQGVCYFGNTFFAILQHFLGLLKLLSQNKGRWRLTGFVFEKRGKIMLLKTFIFRYFRYGKGIEDVLSDINNCIRNMIRRETHCLFES